jgi:hypothetical protein
MPTAASKTAIGDVTGAHAAYSRSARESASLSRVRMATMADASTNIRHAGSDRRKMLAERVDPGSHPVTPRPHAMERTRLSSKGLVTLPKSVRDADQWRPVTEFIVENTAD